MPLLLVLAGLVGVLIGLAGVGGVLLPPGLMLLGDLSAGEAAATSLWTFGFTGVVGTIAYARRGAVPWSMAGWLAAGIAPGAFLGARTNAFLPAPLLVGLMAAFTIGVGAHQLLRRAPAPAGEPVNGSGAAAPRWRTREVGAAALVTVGAIVGFGSALTGTGGPVLLVPLLLALGLPPLRAVAVSQVAQLPVVVAGTVGYLGAGLTDVRLGTVTGIVAGAGAVVGAALAGRAPSGRLRTIVALACIAAGLLLLVGLRLG